MRACATAHGMRTAAAWYFARARARATPGKLDAKFHIVAGRIARATARAVYFRRGVRGATAHRRRRALAAWTASGLPQPFDRSWRHARKQNAREPARQAGRRQTASTGAVQGTPRRRRAHLPPMHRGGASGPWSEGMTGPGAQQKGAARPERTTLADAAR